MDAAVFDDLPTESLRGRRALLRIGATGDASCAVPTLERLISAGARTIVAAGGVDPAGERFAFDLRVRLGRPIVEVAGIGPGDVLHAAERAAPEAILLLPDLASLPGDAVNDPEVARQLGAQADVYCDDAFALAHLPLASTVGIVRFVQPSVAGVAMARDIARMEAVVDPSAGPVGAVIGGADLEGKLMLIWHLCGRVDWLFLGGAICFPFLKAQGSEVGGAPMDDRLVPAARQILKDAAGATRIVLPDDFMVLKRASMAPETVPAQELLATHAPMDIGPASRARVEALLSQTHAALWNGPLGVWEIEPFGESTREVAGMIVELPADRSRVMLCGESLTGALLQFGLWTGALREMGAPAAPVLHFLSGHPLPGVAALRRRDPGVDSRSARIILPIESSESVDLVRNLGALFEGARAGIHLLVSDPAGVAMAVHQANILLSRHGKRVSVETIHDLSGDVVVVSASNGAQRLARSLDAPILFLKPAPNRAIEA